MKEIDRYLKFVPEKSTSWSLGILSKEQTEDEDIDPIFKINENRILIPDEEEMRNISLTVRSYCSLWNSLTIHDGNLKRRLEENDGEVRLQGFVPSKKISEES